MALYKDYFNIDERYFSTINAELIDSGEVDWTKFYPHDTFVNLIKNTYNVLSRKERKSIWVEGEYGTGKSHAALTLKKLIDSSDKETEDYFKDYGLDIDLLLKLQGEKNSGKILTVHRYGSSNIDNDRDLIYAIQSSITQSMIENNISNKGELALKANVEEWLNDDVNKSHFNNLISERHSTVFDESGITVDDLIDKLNNYGDDVALKTLNKISEIANVEGISALKIDIYGLIDWIKNIIEENKLKCILFIWDEFTEYFRKNSHSLTGFQQLVEVSNTSPFYLIIVTHKSEALFNDKDSDKKKILDRFIKPTSKIELPENMAFKLIAAALTKKDDPVLLEEWESYSNELNSNINDAKIEVIKFAKIQDKELADILPIHPYTALVLKQLSSAFESNQRSMFDFIKNDNSQDIKSFQWYISNHSPSDEIDNLLTIDMLWWFFYERGKESLSLDIRTILDTYERQNTDDMRPEAQKVLKTILLLQSISQKVGKDVEIFVPNEKNIANSYDGTKLLGSNVISIAEQFVKDQILFKKAIGTGKYQYSAMIGAFDTSAINENKETFTKDKTTSVLVTEGDLLTAIELPPYLNLRYIIETATSETLTKITNTLRNKMDNHINKIAIILTFAKSEDEAVVIRKIIKEFCEDGSNDFDVIFVDTTLTTLGDDNFGEYIEHISHSSYFMKNDKDQGVQYANLSKEVLYKWKNRITDGEFIISQNKLSEYGTKVNNINELFKKLKEITSNRYPNCLENYNVTETMFTQSSLALGAFTGITQELKSAFKSSNPNTSLKTALSDVWDVQNYWVSNPNLTISKVKIAIEDVIKSELKANGQVKISTIYDVVKIAPFGFIPCNLTAFMFGFVLKEYANDQYRWSDGLVSESMNPEKLRDMIKSVLDNATNPTNKYKETYIQLLGKEEAKFSSATAEIFNINKKHCSSVEATREMLRSKITDFYFPLWCIAEFIPTQKTKIKSEKLIEIIELYSGILNINNTSDKKQEITLANVIGQEFIDNADAIDDLKTLVNSDNTKDGMEKYLKTFNDGILIKMAKEIGDSNYITAIKNKFDATDSNWVWGREICDDKILEVITEYEIVSISNEYNTKNLSFKDAIIEWKNKIDLIKFPYCMIKDDHDDLSNLLALFDKIAKMQNENVSVNDKLSFLNELKTKKVEFYAFWDNQFVNFKSLTKSYSVNLEDSSIEEIYKKIPNKVYIYEKSDYNKLINDLFDTHKQTLSREKLNKYWFDKTKTNSPKEWSDNYSMPILCMVEENETEFKNAFNLINSKSGSEDDVRLALTFLEKQDNFFTNLEIEEKREDAFKQNLLKGFKTILSDIKKVKKELNVISTNPYNWYQNSEIERQIESLAEKEYTNGKNSLAIEKIDNMSADELKSYVKRLVTDNVKFGIEIINEE